MAHETLPCTLLLCQLLGRCGRAPAAQTGVIPPQCWAANGPRRAPASLGQDPPSRRAGTALETSCIRAGRVAPPSFLGALGREGPLGEICRAQARFHEMLQRKRRKLITGRGAKSRGGLKLAYTLRSKGLVNSPGSAGGGTRARDSCTSLRTRSNISPISYD